MAKSGLKWTKMATNDQTWHKSLKNDIQNHLHWISASLAVIWVALWLVCDNFEFVANNFEFVAKIGQIRPQMTKNDIKVWKVISEIICIGFLLLLRSFWVVAWPVYDNFEFELTKRGLKWPKMAWMSIKMTAIDWFDDDTALTDQFWVNVLTSSCSEAGPKFWHREIFLMESRHFEWSHDQFTTILSLGPKSSEIGLKWPQMSAIDWFDGVTALTDQF